MCLACYQGLCSSNFCHPGSLSVCKQQMRLLLVICWQAFDCPFISPLLFFYLILLHFLPGPSSANGPVSWHFFSKKSSIVFVKYRLFCRLRVIAKQLRDDSWFVVGGLLSYGTGICHYPFIYVFYHFCPFFFMFVSSGIDKSDGRVDVTLAYSHIIIRVFFLRRTLLNGLTLRKFVFDVGLCTLFGVFVYG